MPAASDCWSPMHSCVPNLSLLVLLMVMQHFVELSASSGAETKERLPRGTCPEEPPFLVRRPKCQHGLCPMSSPPAGFEMFPASSRALKGSAVMILHTQRRATRCPLPNTLDVGWAERQTNKTNPRRPRPLSSGTLNNRDPVKVVAAAATAAGCSSKVASGADGARWLGRLMGGVAVLAFAATSRGHSSISLCLPVDTSVGRPRRLPFSLFNYILCRLSLVVLRVWPSKHTSFQSEFFLSATG